MHIVFAGESAFTKELYWDYRSVIFLYHLLISAIVKVFNLLHAGSTPLAPFHSIHPHPVQIHSVPRPSIPIAFTYHSLPNVHQCPLVPPNPIKSCQTAPPTTPKTVIKIIPLSVIHAPNSVIQIPYNTHAPLTSRCLIRTGDESIQPLDDQCQIRHIGFMPCVQCPS